MKIRVEKIKEGWYRNRYEYYTEDGLKISVPDQICIYEIDSDGRLSGHRADPIHFIKDTKIMFSIEEWTIDKSGKRMWSTEWDLEKARGIFVDRYIDRIEEHQRKIEQLENCIHKLR